MTARSDDATAGSVIANKYRLDSLLGEGGMGSIWRAFNLQLELPVAIKLLRTDLDAAELGQRLRVEARAVAKLVHPSIVRVFDVGETDWGGPFIVMELLEGESLAHVLDRGPLPAAEALRLLLPIADALALAHSRGVIHRDLKPENIFLACHGDALEPKLLDFGIAKVIRVEAAGERAVTQVGTLLGSPDYMSPEQAYGRSDIDERTDVWSFCVVLYEALTGRLPFQGESCSSLLRSVVRDEPASLETFGVEAELAALVARGLMKNREQRPSSIFELGRELARFLTARGIFQDATGAALETKWLGRAVTPLLPPPPASSPPASLGEQTTLHSVTSPRAVPRHQLIMLEPQRRGPRRVLGAAVVVTSLVGGAAWATWDRSIAHAGTSGAEPPSVATSPAELQRRAAALTTRASIIAVDDLAPLPRGPAAVASPTAKPKAAPIATTTARVAPGPLASRLPRALPARGQRIDLLNPY